MLPCSGNLVYDKLIISLFNIKYFNEKNKLFILDSKMAYHYLPCLLSSAIYDDLHTLSKSCFHYTR